MRSVAVVLPASIWAMMPMFLNLSKPISAIDIGLNASYRTLRPIPFLESVVCKGLVRLSHSVNVLFLLHGAAAAIGRIEQPAEEAVFHRLFAAAPRVRDDPADRQRIAAITGH